MFQDWKTQYSENDYTTQSNLQIQCNPYQITNGIFHRIRMKKFPMCMETQSVLVAQSCMILHDPMDCSPPASSIHWTLQARINTGVAT